ncbi:hypothetical protein B9N43_11650 [Denitratisoma sp. DHT3]|uniref:lipocalin-like domain-containing protein n=1 Tax=Denitratisoma sp. DHT3 TaxID=1981880 RepID=UPI0011985730|nr:lipocalin-like domain-containing protein [Denitratisoma sp. DHT3]QDX81847.1 hypothetical protein B9N43_11650 [Denitratisoma sp. DHT3]
MNTSPSSSAHDANAVLGTWNLVAFEVEAQATGERRPAFPSPSRGRLIVLPEGIMMALITLAPGPLPKTAADQAAAFNTMIAYSGRYRIEGDQFMTDVDLAWHAGWVGSLQLRTYRFVGERLELISAWAPNPAQPEQMGRGILLWERES